MWKRAKTIRISSRPGQKKRVKSAGRFSRPVYECGYVQGKQEEFYDQTMNAEACEDRWKSFKTKL